MTDCKRVWFITGASGSGKSTAACRIAQPSEMERMVVFDTEDSMSDILRQNEVMGVKFGEYIRAYDRFKADENMLGRIASGKLPWVTAGQKSALVGYWEWFIRALNEKLRPHHRYLVIDTIEPLEAGAAAWAEVNRRLSGWSGKTAYGGLEIEAVRPLLQNTFEAIHQRGITDILITSHTKNPWVEYAPKKSRPVLDRVKPGGRLKVWSRISTAMLWLVRPGFPPNPNGTPSAIVLKARRGSTTIDSENDRWINKSMIPPRIPAFDWDAWDWYSEHGWNLLEPREGESLLPDEKRMLSTLLSNEEYRLMILSAELALEDKKCKTKESGSLPAQPNVDDEIRGLVESGMTDGDIAARLNVPPPVVARIRAARGV